MIFAGSEKAAKRIMDRITRYIEEVLKLKVNITKSKVTKPNAIKFLGFELYWDKFNDQYKAKIHQKSIKKFKASLKKPASGSWSINMDTRLVKLREPMRG